MANEYLGWFAIECHFTPSEVYDMPFVALVRLSLLADDVAEKRRNAQNQQATAARQMRPMM